MIATATETEIVNATPTIDDAPASSAGGNDRYYVRAGVSQKETGDLLCCNCATCGVELLAPHDGKFAVAYGCRVAAYEVDPDFDTRKGEHQRPYCPSCLPAARNRRVRCAECKELTPHKSTTRLNGERYCEYCLDMATLKLKTSRGGIGTRECRAPGQAVKAFFADFA